jgi:hypothetical protein
VLREHLSRLIERARRDVPLVKIESDRDHESSRR